MIHDVNGKTNKQIDQHANPIALRKCMGDRVQENQLYVTYHASLSSSILLKSDLPKSIYLPIDQFWPIDQYNETEDNNV